jgi:hypothetical protein
MPRGRFQIVVLAVALLFANAWCVAQCVITPSPSHVPPCHRHHQSVKACASTVAVEAANAVPHAPTVTVSEVQTTVCSRTAETPAHDLSPPPPLVSTPMRA